jgi:DNA-binding response OmpR family regulator
MKILLADDDKLLVDLLSFAFQREGNAVVAAHDGEATLRLFRAEAPDLVVLDLNMPKLGGMEVLREIRYHSLAPILILTAQDDPDQTVKALERGADDYVSKPFHPQELRARVNALLRRARYSQPAGADHAGLIAYNDITLNPETQEVKRGPQLVPLTHKEFGLLHYLMLNHDIVVSVDQIVANVWGYDNDASDDVVKVYISRLRRKLEADPAHPHAIVTKAGAGYLFSSDN